MAAAHRNPNTSARPFRLSADGQAAPSPSPISLGQGITEGAKAVRFPLPDVARDALSIIESAGGEAWCVGGFVRDALLGRPIHDVDIACSLPWPITQRAFQEAGWGTVETGVAHGTLTVVRDGEPLEITTYRLDGSYSDGRHPDSVAAASTIEEDLQRRDFTINALAYHPERGVIDPFGGVADMEAGVLRCVGDPMTRFSEDALRILRACRFASQLGVAIDPATFEAMVASKNLLRKVSGERIYRELERFVCGDYVHDALMSCVDVLAFVLPELVAMKGFVQHTKYHIYDVLEHTAWVCQHTPPEPLQRWSALFHDMGKPAASFFEGDVEHFYGHAAISVQLSEGIMHRLPFPAWLRRDVPVLVRTHDDVVPANARAVRRMLGRLGGRTDLFEALCDIKRADALSQAPFCAPRADTAEELRALMGQILEEEAAFSVKHLAINGRDIMALGVEAGPEVGRILNACLDAVIDEQVPNEREALIGFITQQRDQI
ncbi:CCA tRNA nucleotidyltransferase [uncultured Adlercreutzia sp.]|uniref:CCA tRNA nucleotidyltransferase n=1 Tax=uncultured Adlercreutzia sp. TaxID=875803 RepID=UPI0025FE0AFD|nr:HD domain-containing protein [uncultured Adlercreutzia sp.]